MPTFEVKTPVGANQIWMRQQIREAVAEATRRGKLRPNSVDSITGKNSGDNLGPGTPIIHFDQWERDAIEIKLILKGGGCENTNAQYALPVELPHLGRADRTLDGVRKCILHAVWNAQGKGCAPGAVGVCVGGDRTSGYTPRQGAAVPHARRHQSRSAAGGGRSRDHGDRQRSRDRHDGVRRQGHAHRLQDRRAQPPAGQLLRVGRLRLLGVPPARRRAERVDRRDRPLAVPRSLASDHSDARSGGLHAHRPGDRAAIAAHRGGGARAEGRRRRDDLGPDVHRPRRGPFAPDEARAAGGSARVGPLPLRSGRREGRRRLARHRRGPDDEHPRGAVSGRDHQALRRARGHRQGRHGREDAGGAEGTGRGLPERRSAARRSSTRGRSSASTACRCSSSARPKRCGT